MGLGQIPSSGGGGGGAPPVADTTLKRLSLTPDALTGSSALSSLSIAQTWNTAGTPTAVDVDVTDTASNAASLLLNLRVGGVSKAKVTKAGDMTVNTLTASSSSNSITTPGNVGAGSVGTYPYFAINYPSGRFSMHRDSVLTWTTAGDYFNTATTFLGCGGAATVQLGTDHATAGTKQTLKAHDVTTGKGAGLDLVGGSSGNGANSGDVRMMAGTAEGVKVYHDETAGAAGIGFFGVGGTLRPTTAFSGATFLPGMGTQVTEDATFGGYTLAQVVYALQALGLLS